jgi:hypothetical protein
VLLQLVLRYQEFPSPNQQVVHLLQPLQLLQELLVQPQSEP